jgi:hypothetical protein
MKKMLIACAAVLSCTPSLLRAQAPAPAETPAPAAAPTPPPLPSPAPELQKLAFLVGDWVHEETFHPSPMGPGGPARGRSKSAWALGDHHVYTIYTTNSPLGKLEARGLFGWDAEKKAYRLSWFDNMGMMTSYGGNFEGDDTLAMSAEYTIQGNAVKERLTIKKQADGKLLFSSTMAGPDGAFKPMLDSLATPDAKK